MAKTNTPTRARTRKTAEAETKPGTPEITLHQVVVATMDPDRGFVYTKNEEFVSAQENAGHIEVNETKVGPDGEIMIRATQAGIDFVAAEQKAQESVDSNANSGVESGSSGAELNQAPANTNQTNTQGTKMTSFAIQDGFELPSISRGRNADSKYPIDALNVKQSFFVPSSNFKNGNAAKSLASTVSAANQKHSEVIPGEFRTMTKGPNKGQSVAKTKQVREFAVRATTENGVEGARVFRIL